MNRGDQARKISIMQCEMIERDNYSRKKKPVVIASKKRSRWQSGICKICGEYFDCITQEHAHRHGFKNADEMAQSDAVDFGKRVVR